MLIALLLQATAPAPAPAPQRIDLIAAGDARCAGHEQDIVVCARRNGNRIARLRDRPDTPALPMAVVKLPGGGTGDVHVEQGTIEQTGETTRRLMVGTSFPF